ncbi:MAG TPA: acyltransferase family protein [Steroidobacteraceae bacterium]|nr:acyltransferase family protein [Steroidobacteraceae bacterium]
MNATDRFHALDAVRGFALLAGIVLHATMSFFLPTPAHDVSQSTTLAVMFFVIHTFRMTLFFIIAGFFARLLIERRGIRGFIGNRTGRIAGPMLVAWVILAPLTTAILIWSALRSLSPEAAAVTWAGIVTSPAALLPHSLKTVPLMHVWFLYYLCILYLMALALCWLFSRILDRSGRGRGALDGVVRVLLSSYFAPWVLALPLFLVLGFDDRVLMMMGIPTPDGGLDLKLPPLVAFGTAFALGWFVHRQQAMLGEWPRRWVGHLSVGATLTVLCLTVLRVAPGAITGWLDHSAMGSRALYLACYFASIWYWSLGITGAALRFCSGESAVRRYLADSSYWLYLVHLPVVFALQVIFASVPWPWAIKFPLIVGIALTVLLLSYHFLVRPTWIGRILNGRKYPRRPAAVPKPSRPALGLGGLGHGGPLSASHPDTW